VGIDIGIPVDSFLMKHPLLGWLLFFSLFIGVMGWAVGSLVNNIPAFLKLKALILLPIARKIRFRKLEKEAIKSDIQGKVNYVVKRIAAELPEGSIKPLEIVYVERTEEKSFIEQNKVYVRIKPVENQEDNFLNVTRLYLEMVLVPNSKPLLSVPQKKAITYFTAQKIVEENKRILQKLHNDYYLPDVKKYASLKDYFEKIKRIDSRGFFYSIVLRTIERGAVSLLFKPGSLRKGFDDILLYLCEFISKLKKGEVADELWKYHHPGASFYLLLVAHPLMAKVVTPKSYVNRLLDDLKKTEFVFVIFSQAEWNFGKQVAKAMDNTAEIELIETIRTDRDYRGKKGGIIKLYAKKGTKPYL